MPSKLQVALGAATQKVCAEVATKYGPEDIYSFALYTSPEYSYVCASFSTLVGLRKVAEKYLADEQYREDFGTVDVAMKELKWIPGDSPYHEKYGKEFKAADKALNGIWENIVSDSDQVYLDTCRQIHEVFTETLKKVRASGVFKNNVLLNVLMGDQSEEECLLNAEPLNSAKVLASYRKNMIINARDLEKLRKKRWLA